MSLTKPEQEFNAWLRATFTGPGMDYMRVENSLMAGVPDVNICANGFDVWIEAKVNPEKPIMRKEQFAWGVRRSHAGGSVFVLNLRAHVGIIDIYQFPSILVRPWGTDNRYVVATHQPDYYVEKFHKDSRALLRKFLFPTL